MPAKKTTAKKTAARPARRGAKSAVKRAPAKKAGKRAKVISVEVGGPELTAFVAAGNHLKAEGSQMFGKPCFKVKGKAFTCYFNGDMVFKLGGKEHERAMKLKGAKLFDPSGSGRAMKEWVQVPLVNKSKWNDLAAEAMKYVKSSAK